MNRRELMLAMGGVGLAGLAEPAFAQDDDVRLNARDGWIYGLPIIEMAATRARHLKAGAKLNSFAGGRALADHTSRNVTTPNNDTLYLSAWVDLTAGPVTLVVPEMSDRYWSVAVMDMFTNNNAVLGSRTVGPDGGTFALVGPRHPEPARQMWGTPRPVRVDTPHAWVLARVLVDGPEDVRTVQALLRGFSLTGKTGEPPAGMEASRTAPASDYFRTLHALTMENPPPATDEAILRQCSEFVRWGPRPPRTDERQARMEAGVEDARRLVSGGWGRDQQINGWIYPRANLGDYGQDYGYRAVIALGGLAALPQAEAMYLRPVGEKDGLFHSDRAYRLSLPPKVPVEAFWSLSMYEATPEGQFFFTDNPLGRYAIGDRTRGLKRRADGGIDIWIARSDPGGERTSNWLPAPRTGPYIVTWRGYLPGPALLNGVWRMPAIEAA